MQQQIPLTDDPNQEFQVTLEINGVNRPFKFLYVWNEIAGYWVFTMTDLDKGEIVLDSIPLVSGEDASYNILRKLGYLLIGTAYLVPAVAEPTTDYPVTNNLEEEFALIWDDNV